MGSAAPAIWSSTMMTDRQIGVDVRIAPESGRIRDSRSMSQKCQKATYAPQQDLRFMRLFGGPSFEEIPAPRLAAILAADGSWLADGRR
jgi:hypothetical protein